MNTNLARRESKVFPPKREDAVLAMTSVRFGAGSRPSASGAQNMMADIQRVKINFAN
jgi:hypothetical protein